MTQAKFIYVTAPDRATAIAIARALVEKRLAACVNVLPGVSSVYRWKGAVETAEEVALIVKTSTGPLAAAIAEIKRRHPYETPAISAFEVFPEEETLQWICDETAQFHE
jgi:periplasmic divalent cation tolerance protein